MGKGPSVSAAGTEEKMVRATWSLAISDKTKRTGKWGGMPPIGRVFQGRQRVTQSTVVRGGTSRVLPV